MNVCHAWGGAAATWPLAARAQQDSDSVPVVFTLVADPVSTGMIESLARPGRNATGFTNFEFSIGGKWLELLKEVSPGLTRVTVIANPANPTAYPLARVIEDVGRTISITVATASVHGANDIQAAISGDGQQSGGGLGAPSRTSKMSCWANLRSSTSRKAWKLAVFDIGMIK